ncbi:hypothetical protein NDU88_002621 [Pleurodeles waltl]|uniref:Uncharacterized protein n=1 Tax=Pleurodeles waltl TaxID=8319 RepID=A0AAV7NE50_PLEWA|nr:hypothetical protein NDU88_002621 [Pleurodeles waltl]
MERGAADRVHTVRYGWFTLTGDCITLTLNTKSRHQANTKKPSSSGRRQSQSGWAGPCFWSVQVHRCQAARNYCQEPVTPQITTETAERQRETEAIRGKVSGGWGVVGSLGGEVRGTLRL